MKNKITLGFVIQEYDQDGNCTHQSFIAEDGCTWEDENGDVVNAPDHVHFAFEMKQPNNVI